MHPNLSNSWGAFFGVRINYDVRYGGKPSVGIGVCKRSDLSGNKGSIICFEFHTRPSIIDFQTAVKL